ncbi:jg11803 [Pararge aegeria aegeria]|uniref:Jg11803 protein n=1 Tax=Pararge aegeria aegeria TaxID=348720 RepID=A0A8S4S8V4_9NEOP|nr:jg11803 [Pararge aegeria aegeria]
MAYLPFVRGVTDTIGRLLKQRYDIKTVFTPLQKIAHLMRSPKDRLPYQCPGVYKIDCSCGSSYIGQTKRSIATRVTGHIKAVRDNETQKSAIAEHILQGGTQHWIELHDPTQTQVLSTVWRSHLSEDGFKLASVWPSEMFLKYRQKEHESG